MTTPSGTHIDPAPPNGAFHPSSPSTDLPPSYAFASASAEPAPPNAPSNPPFVAADYASDNKKHLLFACSGSVATIKAPLILQSLASHTNLSIRVILTASAARFLGGQSPEQPHWNTLLAIPNVEAIYFDEDEWIHPWTRGAPILHIELRRWSHILVVAPLSANALAKMVNGFADNLLTSVMRAWDPMGVADGRGISNQGGLRRRIVVAPAMNTLMLLHPVTEKQMNVLTDEWGVDRPQKRKGHGYSVGWVEVLKPKAGELACGDVGIGAMADWQEVVRVIKGRLYL